MNTITLRNGTEQHPALVNTIMATLSKLTQPEPPETPGWTPASAIKNLTAFHDLVMVCRDPGYEIFSETQVQILRDLGLLEADGRPHDAIRDIVVSAVVGEGMGMQLRDPRLPEGEQPDIG